jgi:putative SOS response-associated peptidase YedK
MCGRYALGLGSAELEEFFDTASSRLEDWSPRWNIAPTTSVPIVIEKATSSDVSERVVGPARWSLTPPWSDSLDTPYPTFNARSETAATKPSFRQAVAHHRALIPASGYFEWHASGRVKTPHYIFASDGAPLVFAGLYSIWTGEGSPVVTCTILTREAPANLEWIHPRAPVALSPQFWGEWLDARTVGDTDLVARAVSDSDAVYATISEHAVLPLRGDGPELVAPRPEAPTLLGE